MEARNRTTMGMGKIDVNQAAQEDMKRRQAQKSGRSGAGPMASRKPKSVLMALLRPSSPANSDFLILPAEQPESGNPPNRTEAVHQASFITRWIPSSLSIPEKM